MSLSLRYSCLLVLSLAAASTQSGFAQTPAAAHGVSRAQAVLSHAASENKFTFLVFFKQNDAATAAMSSSLQKTLAEHADQCVVTFVKVDDPAERALVAQYDVARSPMPLSLAIAPNGAITGLLGAKFAAEHVHNSFVTPTMMSAMKSLQGGKLVFVTVRGAGGVNASTALSELQTDPHFGPRMVTLAMNAADPDEALFMEQMKIDPRTNLTRIALLAPPGMLVAKFDANASKNEIAAALADAGKCCDDPNCKHNQSAGRTTAAPKSPRK